MLGVEIARGLANLTIQFHIMIVFRVILSEAKNLLRLLPYISQYPSIHIKDVTVDSV